MAVLQGLAVLHTDNLFTPQPIIDLDEPVRQLDGLSSHMEKITTIIAHQKTKANPARMSFFHAVVIGNLSKPQRLLSNR